MSCSVCRGYDSHDCPVCGMDSTIEKCPECYGTGIDQKLAFNIRTREFVKVTEIAWLMLPKSEDEAEARGQNYCRAEEKCPYCKGLGEVRKVCDNISRRYNTRTALQGELPCLPTKTGRVLQRILTSSRPQTQDHTLSNTAVMR